MADDCKHKWGAFTPYKAECQKCGKKTPWLDLLAAMQHRAERAEFLRDQATSTLGRIERWAERRPVLPPDET